MTQVRYGPLDRLACGSSRKNRDQYRVDHQVGDTPATEHSVEKVQSGVLGRGQRDALEGERATAAVAVPTPTVAHCPAP